MDVIKAHIPAGHPNRPGKKLEALKAIVIHYTQNDNPKATDTMNVKYIGRTWEQGYYWSESKKVAVIGPIEAGSSGKGPNNYGIGFRYGSAHVFCDMDSVTEAIPLDEVAWGCGDKNYKGGYQRVAEKIFKRRQNYQTVSVEICNNDAVKNSDIDWQTAVENAKKWVVEYLTSHNIKVSVEGSLNPQLIDEMPADGSILLLRHYDVTGKKCPAPFVDSQEDWKNFVSSVAEQVNNYGA